MCCVFGLVFRQGVHDVLAIKSSSPSGVDVDSSSLNFSDAGLNGTENPSSRLSEAELKARATGSLATPVYVPETRAPPNVNGGPSARDAEEAYQSSIKHRAAQGQALAPDEIFRRAKAAGSLAV